MQAARLIRRVNDSRHAPLARRTAATAGPGYRQRAERGASRWADRPVGVVRRAQRGLPIAARYVLFAVRPADSAPDIRGLLRNERAGWLRITPAGPFGSRLP